MLNSLIRFYLIRSWGLPFSEDYGSFEALKKELKKKKKSVSDSCHYASFQVTLYFLSPLDFSQ